MDFKPFKDVDTDAVKTQTGASTSSPTKSQLSTMSSSSQLKIQTRDHRSERNPSAAYDVIRLLKTWYNDGSNKYSPEDIAVAVQQVVAQKKYSTNVRWLLIVSCLFFTASVAVLVVGIVYGVHQLKQSSVDEHDLLFNPKDGKPLRVQQHYQYLPVKNLNVLPLEQVEKLESLVLQWGQSGSENEVKYYYNIESASRKGHEGTRLKLSSGHSLMVMPGNALLYNEKGDVIGELRFDVLPKQLVEDEKSSAEDKKNTATLPQSAESAPRGKSNDQTNSAIIQEVATEDTDGSRRLGKKNNQYGKYPQNAPTGQPADFFDAYCRYGCGGMAVTFPYFYRPFFGYGFPLVGTEAMFPAGYGGNPSSEIMAAQAGLGGVAGRNAPVLSSGVPVTPGLAANSPAPVAF